MIDQKTCLKMEERWKTIGNRSLGKLGPKDYQKKPVDCAFSRVVKFLRENDLLAVSY